MTNQIEQIDVDQIKEEIFKATPHHLVADIIAEHNPTIRITDRLIESYLDIANSKDFTLDMTILEIRRLNPFDSKIENRLMFELNDGSYVAIKSETMSKLQESINNLEVVEYMRTSVENFIGVVDALEE